HCDRHVDDQPLIRPTSPGSDLYPRSSALRKGGGFSSLGEHNASSGSFRFPALDAGHGKYPALGPTAKRLQGTPLNGSRLGLATSGRTAKPGVPSASRKAKARVSLGGGTSVRSSDPSSGSAVPCSRLAA